MKTIRVLTVLLMLAVVPLASQAAAFDYFLKIDGIEGESTDRASKGLIEVLSFSWGLSNSSSASAGGGGGAGKVSVHDISITKVMDKSSPKLMEACAKGQHIKEAVITCRRSGGRDGRSVEYLTITLQDCLVSSYQISGDGDGATDKITLSFSKLRIKTASGGDGSISIDPRAD